MVGPGDRAISGQSRTSSAPLVQVTGFRNLPSFSISISTTSPDRRNFGGSKPMPTPSGVPVAMMSPGSNVMPLEMVAMSFGMSK